MPELREVPVGALPIDRLEPIIGPERAGALQVVADAARETLTGRTIWNINSTAVGGGVAEMLQVLLCYAKGAGLDTRWLVLEADPEFFTVTKRLHNRLHGFTGDGGPLAAAERATYEQTLADNAVSLAELVRPGDVVLLHDPQTAGLVEAVKSLGATVVWRCHVGTDVGNEHVESAWEFLREHLAAADAYVFSRRAHVPPDLPADRVFVIMPSIDPLAPKNQELAPAVVRAVLGRMGFLDEVPGPAPEFERRDLTTSEVTRSASFPRRGDQPDDATPLVAQISRWDHLKDMAGVLAAFAAHVPPPAHLALVGPSVERVTDDPEGAAVLRACVDLYDGLPPDARARIHLVSLPVDDADENAVMVNAIQRRATVVVQKSLQEGFGLTVAEAMVKARPVVASRIGGIQDQIRHEQEGLLVEDPTDPEELARHLNRLLAAPDLADSLGEAARRRAVGAFLPDRHLAEYADLLFGLIGRG